MKFTANYYVCAKNEDGGWKNEPCDTYEDADILFHKWTTRGNGSMMRLLADYICIKRKVSKEVRREHGIPDDAEECYEEIKEWNYYDMK
jgi:hypothetical protein